MENNERWSVVVYGSSGTFTASQPELSEALDQAKKAGAINFEIVYGASLDVASRINWTGTFEQLTYLINELVRTRLITIAPPGQPWKWAAEHFLKDGREITAKDNLAGYFGRPHARKGAAQVNEILGGIE